YFYSQAKDGIRDFHVTGVQTCALPISNRVVDWSRPQGPEQKRDRKAKDDGASRTQGRQSGEAGVGRCCTGRDGNAARRSFRAGGDRKSVVSGKRTELRARFVILLKKRE